jgi:GntR family transcriptional regulator / MocR family aminotransferase
MAKRSGGHPLPLLAVPGERPGQPRYLKLYRRIREAILQGAVPPGTRLPSARTLARDEGLSRNTVEAAFRQLQAEGFVTRRVGSGTRVSDCLPRRTLTPARFGGDTQPSAPSPTPGSGPPVPPHLSARGRAMALASDDAAAPGLLFAPCVPGYDALPVEPWNRIAARHARRASGSLMVPPPPAGLPELRRAVAAYLAMSRGVRCTPERVIVLTSTQQAVDLAARLLLDPGDAVWFEDPGYVSARRAFTAAGARLVPVPVDGEGVDVAAGAAVAPDARLAYVTPSHQYPLGVTLSLARRLALLEWARRSEAWILEDDYDSELRYDGPALASVQGIDVSDRVLYVGTFNKILFPALRVAYLILPEALVEPFARARTLVDGFSPPLPQRVLAEFIDEGHFAVHLRRARALYRERRDRFLEAAAEHLPATVRPGPARGGMHVTLHLPASVDDADASREARRRGLALPALTSYFLGRGSRGLLAHYGNVPERDMQEATRRLGEVLGRPVRRSGGSSGNR